MISIFLSKYQWFTYFIEVINNEDVFIIKKVSILEIFSTMYQQCKKGIILTYYYYFYYCQANYKISAAKIQYDIFAISQRLRHTSLRCEHEEKVSQHLFTLFIYSFIHLFIYSFIRLFIYSFIHLFIYSFIHLFVYSFIHLFIYSFIHLFIYSFIHLFIYSFIHLFIYSLVH